MKNILKHPILKIILSALAIAFFGYLFLILTFLFDSTYQGTVRNIVGLFIPLEPESTLY